MYKECHDTRQDQFHDCFSLEAYLPGTTIYHDIDCDACMAAREKALEQQAQQSGGDKMEGVEKT
jgi:hypothetical protein